MDFDPFSRNPCPPGWNILPDHELKDLIQLVSNVNDAFTAALFLYNPLRDRLFLSAHHTLSLQVNPKTISNRETA